MKTGSQFSAQHTVDYCIITLNQSNSWFIQNYYSPKNIHYKLVSEPIKESCVIFLQNIDQDGQLSTYSSQSLSTSITLLSWPLLLSLSIVLPHLLYSVIVDFIKQDEGRKRRISIKVNSFLLHITTNRKVSLLCFHG